MKIIIQARGIDLTDGLREHVERRIRFALDWAHHHLNRVSVRLSDQNGPRGGEDKRCQIQLKLDGAPPLVIEDTEADLYTAVGRAADRTGRTLARQLGRQRQHRRSTPRDTALVADPALTASSREDSAITFDPTLSNHGVRHAFHS